MKILLWSERFDGYKCMGDFDIDEALEIMEVAMLAEIEDDDGNNLEPTNIYYSFRENALVIEAK